MLTPVQNSHQSLLMSLMRYFLKNLQTRVKQLSLDAQDNDEAGPNTHGNEPERPSYIYIIKQSAANGFIDFLQRSKPAPANTRTVSREIYRHLESFTFSEYGKGAVKFSDVIGDAFMALPFIDIDNGNIIVSDLDYFKILQSVQQDADVLEDEFELEDPELDAAQDSGGVHTVPDSEKERFRKCTGEGFCSH